VTIHPSVRAAFLEAPVSHRAEDFVREFQQIRQRLCRLVNAGHVQMLLGSGTLANDAVAAQLSLRGAHGVVLSNGEFGERLVTHARRFGLSFDTLSVGWGEPLPYAKLRRWLAERSAARWVWAVHCETSTGVLNDLALLREISRERGVHLCLDCISSIGTVPVDLAGVYLATGVSGKGLGSYPGLSMVFHSHEIEPSPDLPCYLDLGTYARHEGPPFTTSSNLVYALGRSLSRVASANGRRPAAPEALFEAKRSLARWLRPELQARGLQILAPAEISSPAVMTVVLPRTVDSVRTGEQLEREGILVHFRSEYLVCRNWIQVCLMGDHTRSTLAPLLDRLPRLVSR
jgi:aspartate aminotransferase-like enzyme